jgi:hypothetical protein
VLTVENAWEWRYAIPAETVALQLMRPLKSGESRMYEAMECHGGAKGIGLFLTRLLFTEDTEGAYGMIDLLDADGCIIEEIGVPDRDQFQRIRRKLKCRVLDFEAEAARVRALKANEGER